MITEDDKNFFQRKPANLRIGLLFLIGLVLVFIVLGAFVTYFYVDDNIQVVDLTPHQKKDISIFIIATILGLLGNLISSIIWDRWLKFQFAKKELHNLKRIEALADTTLLNDALSLINSYAKITLKGLIIRCKLLDVKNSKLLKCSVKRSFERLIPNEVQTLQFYFVRINDEIDETEIERVRLLSNSNSEIIFLNEFDEKSFDNGDKALIDSNSYILKELFFNGEKLDFSLVDNDNKNVVIYKSINLPKTEGFVEIEFHIEYLIEKESLHYFTIDYPTFDVECEFDYSDVQDKIIMYPYEFVTSTKPPNFLSLYTDPILRYRIKDNWVFPKSTFLFAWYEK